MKILIATGNPGKFKEISGILQELGHEFVSLSDLKIDPKFEEIGDSFEEIAIAKATHFSRISGLPVVADDSGIFVSALAEELGLKTRRWGAGENATDEEWLRFFMKRMEKEKDRSAKFVCAAVFVDGKKVFRHVEDTDGVITESIEVEIKAGLPLSSVFKPLPYDKVYSALSDEEKNKISHRGKAFKKLLKTLKNA